MSSLNSPPPHLSAQDDLQFISIDFWKILQFLLHHYQRLILGAALGLLVGFVIVFGKSSYKAEAIIPNQWGVAVNVRAEEAGWVSLAQEIASEPGLSADQKSFYETLSKMAWWQKALTPNYAVTKADIKDLVGSNEIKNSSIINFEIKWVGANADLVGQRLQQVIQFMRTASAYIALRNIVNGYEVETFSATAAIEKNLHDSKLQLILNNRRLTNLEDLQKRFPGNSLAANQVVDPKGSGAKYLPIPTQIIAAKSDIFATQESITQLQARFEQAQLLNQFIVQAKPLITQERDGLKLAEQLHGIEAQLRAGISADNLSQLIVLDRIRLDINNVQAQFLLRKDQPVYPVITRNSSWMSGGLLGMLGGIFISLLACIGLQFWPVAKARLQELKNDTN